jgi:hypothetical protein
MAVRLWPLGEEPQVQFLVQMLVDVVAPEFSFHDLHSVIALHSSTTGGVL